MATAGTKKDAQSTVGAASGAAGTVGATADPALQAEHEALRERAAKAAAKHKVAHPGLADRQQAGRKARTRTPRQELARWSPAPDRADPVSLIVGQEPSRVPELLPVRHARMSQSAFAFYRGAALVMAADLATTPRSGLNAQLCGDAHLSNFGLFAAPDRTVIFDVNDFDETNPGPFEWDVKRLATSCVLAARGNNLPDDVARAAADAACASYRQAMADFAGKTELQIWYDRLDSTGLLEAVQEGLVEEQDKRGRAGKNQERKASKKDQREAQVAVEKTMAKAHARDAWSAILKTTEVVDGHRRFRNTPPLLTRLEMDDDAAAALDKLFRVYRATLQDDRRELLTRYEIVDMGHKVVGVGSVGLLDFVLLLRGRDEDDLLVMQVKQAQAAVLEAFTNKSVYSKHGHRVVAGQRLMQAASDSFLGWIDGPGGRNFYVRQLRDMKWSPDPAALTATRLQPYAVACGRALAQAHARSGDAVAIASYMGKGRAFDKAITKFSLAYADQADKDFGAFTAAIADGRISAHEDVGGGEAVQASQWLTEHTTAKKAPRKKPVAPT